MKIALFTTDNREHDKDYSAIVPRFGTAPTALLQGFEQLPEMEVHVVSCLQQPVKSPEKIASNIFYHALHVPKSGWMRTLYRGCIRATRDKLREIGPDMVHGQGTERDCALAAVRSGFPNVLTIHGNMKAIAEIYHAGFGSYHWLAAKLETAALKRTAGVFCNSAYTESLVSPRAKKVWRVPNALRQEFFEPSTIRPAAELPVLLNVGVVEPRKQQVELLALARRLHEQGLKFVLHFAGNHTAGTDYGRLFRQHLAEAEVAGYARHLGLLSATELRAAMDTASALVHFPTEEAFGLVVAEGLARNRKFFGANTGGVGEIARNIDGAELFPPTDFTALQKAIKHWLEAGCPQPARAAIEMRERYHPLVIARRHLEIYREVLHR
jgi:glycosyltransferase involved in cell wall biosynthesis